MKLAFCSDVHAGNHQRFGGKVTCGMNVRCRQVVETVGLANERAEHYGCGILVVAGDLTDTVKPLPQLEAELIAALSGDLEKALLLGNHDMESTAEGDHALGPFSHAGLRVYERPALRFLGAGKDEVDLVMVPFQPGPSETWLPAALEKEMKFRRNCRIASRVRVPVVLVIHLGIEDDQTKPWLRDAADSIKLSRLRQLCELHEVDAVFAGNWHEHKVWPGKTLICQIGALCPTGFDNPGLDQYGMMPIYDTREKTVEVVRIPGPRFLKFNGIGELNALLEKRYVPWVKYLYAQVVEPTVDTLAQARNQLEAHIKAGAVFTGEVILAEEDVPADAIEQAAQAARPTVSMDEAIADWAGDYSFPQGVSREEVSATMKGYLSKET